MMKEIELHATIYGLVQGVCFRAITREAAIPLGVTGRVRNLPNGSVEIIAQGPQKKIESLLAHLTGPQGPGRIDRIEKEWRQPTEYYSDFRIVR